MPTTQSDLRKLARLRLREAQALFDKKLYDGCEYLAGYVIELALKARICKTLNTNDYPDTGERSRVFKTHNLDDLLFLSGLQRRFDEDKRTNPALFTNWSLITPWSEQYRYNPVGSSNKVHAKQVLEALKDQNNGVFSWIKKRW
ncbi:MAG TPA: HEPN domain-containing protein [bacterium]|nr:HEPN domain-containing protein [bacterium]